MKNLKFTRLLALTVLMSFTLAGTVHAVNYTAIKEKKKTEERVETGKKEKIVCSAEDKSNMKKYLRVVDDYTGAADKVNAEPGIVDDRRQREKIGREMEKFNEFVLSEEFEDIKTSYKNCGQDLPLGPLEMPFWAL